MVFLPSLSPEELRRYHGVISQAAKVRTHFDVLEWLQGDMQQYLAHDIMIAAWGDFDQGAIQHDIISALDGVRSLAPTYLPLSPTPSFPPIRFTLSLSFYRDN